jgi:hypothetical protein
VFDVNVRAAVQAAQAVLPGMRARGWGRIINVTSLVTLGLPDRTSYGAGKAAMDFCTRAWAGELATTGMTVNSVAPGPTETELFRENNPPGSPGETRTKPGSSPVIRCAWTAAVGSMELIKRRGTVYVVTDGTAAVSDPPGAPLNPYAPQCRFAGHRLSLGPPFDRRHLRGGRSAAACEYVRRQCQRRLMQQIGADFARRPPPWHIRQAERTRDNRVAHHQS